MAHPVEYEEAWASAAALHERAEELAGAGSLLEAEQAARLAVAGLEAVLPADHPDVANALDTLAGIVASRGRVPEALALWRRALAAFEALRHEEIVRQMRLPVLRSFAYALLQAGEYTAAERLIDEYLAEAEQLWGPDDAAAGWGHNLRGVLYKFQGRHDEAEAAYLRALAILRRDARGCPPGLLHNLAGLACSRGDYGRAEALSREAIERRRADHAQDLVGLAGDLAGLGDALAGQGGYAEAIDRYREALRLYRDGGHAEHPEVAYCLHNLADALAEHGDADEAERCYRDSLARKEACFGAQHHEVAAGLANLAVLLADGGRFEQAEDLFRRASAIARELPSRHPVRVGCDALAARLFERG